MRYMWKSMWKNGEVSVEAEDPMELEEGIKNLSKIEAFQDSSRPAETGIPQKPVQPTSDEYPALPGGLQGSEAIRQALSTPWGRKPRTMAELRSCFEQNALYYDKGPLSGTLTYLTKKGDLRRIDVGGTWGYILNKRE